MGKWDYLTMLFGEMDTAFMIILLVGWTCKNEVDRKDHHTLVEEWMGMMWRLGGKRFLFM